MAARPGKGARAEPEKKPAAEEPKKQAAGKRKEPKPQAKKQPAKPETKKQKAVKPPEMKKPRAEEPAKDRRTGKQKEAKPPVKPPETQKPKRRQRTTAEWRKIRLEYVKGNMTLREIAEKWELSESTLRKRASNERWKKRKNKLDEKVEQKVLERVCDARAREFEKIALVNDRMGEILDNLVSFIQQQPPRKYDDMRGVESLTKAISQVVAVKRDLYSMPNEAEKAKIEALREKAKLEREKWQDEQAEKAAGRKALEDLRIRVEIAGGDGEVGALDE